MNGQEIPDSNVILDTLEAHFKIPVIQDAASTAVGRSVAVMLENHTIKIGFYWRYGHHMTEFIEKVCTETFPRGVIKSWKFYQPLGTKLANYFSGLGRHSLAELIHFSCQDLQAVSDILSTKEFFTGDTPTRIDCTLFGHLVQFVYMPMDLPQKEYMLSHADNLVRYVDRVRKRLWPDWDQMCAKACMEGYMGKDYMDMLLKETNENSPAILSNNDSAKKGL